MSHIVATIARIPYMSTKERAAIRKNANDKLAKPAFAADARRILDALNAFDSAQSSAEEREVTGLLSWEKHRHAGPTFRAFYGTENVGRIFKRANHTSAHKEVYSVEILGETLPASFQHIRDAREAGERMFVMRHSQ